MLLLIEIILTIFAWRKGWKWRALLPLGICLCLGFMIGVTIGALGGNVESVDGIVILDIIAVIALIIMTATSPKSKEVIEQSVNKEVLTEDKNTLKNE